MNIFITGASKGIGYAITKLFLKQGYTVYAGYNNTKDTLFNLKESLNSNNLFPIKIDVTKKSSIIEAYEKTGGIDVLINNAGIAQIKEFIDITEEDFNQMIDTDLKSAFLCSQIFLPFMLKQKKGHIINITSIWGVTGGSWEVHYSAAKSGLIGLTKALAKEMGPSNIKVNAIAPGVIDTDMNKNLTDEEIDYLKNQTPLNKIGLPIDVAKAALFLVENDFITGEVININGGFHI